MTEIAEQGPEEPDPGDRRHGAVESAHGQLVRRRTGAPPAGPEPGAGIAAHLDRAAAVRVRPDDRAAGAVGKPAAGRRPGFDQQQHRQPALSRRDGLARVRRGHERRRADPARRIPAASTAGWISPPATATATSVEKIAKRAVCPKATSRARRSSWRAKARRRAVHTVAPEAIARRMSGFYLIDKACRSSNARRKCAPSIFEVMRARLRPVCCCLFIWARSALLTLCFTLGLAGAGACRRTAGWLLALLGDPAARLHQPAGHRAGELARHPAGDAASAAAHGLLRREFRRTARTLVVVPTMLASARTSRI